jgi:hypothetical protein
VASESKPDPTFIVVGSVFKLQVTVRFLEANTEPALYDQPFKKKPVPTSDYEE